MASGQLVLAPVPSLRLSPTPACLSCSATTLGINNNDTKDSRHYISNLLKLEVRKVNIDKIIFHRFRGDFLISICVQIIDKPARLTIRVLWVLVSYCAIVKSEANRETVTLSSR